MADDSHRTGLYSWRRQTPKSSNRVYSRSQNCKTDGDIQSWLTKVELSSESNIAVASSGLRPRKHGKRDIQNIEHEQVVNEAQELLNNWMQEENYFDDSTLLDEDGYSREKPVIRGEWDHLMDDYHDYNITPRPRLPDLDPYSDEDEAIENILSNMLEKQVVKREFLDDLGLSPEQPREDPRLKMELRHKQVKDNREKRERLLLERRQKQQEKKNSVHEAKQLLLKEEKDREMKSQREEQEIRRQMALIRKSMHNNKRHVEEYRERNISNSALEPVQNKEPLIETVHAVEDTRHKQFEKIQNFQIKQVAKNLKCLHRHFSSWYKIVLERRLQLGKARALFDWKLVLSSWSAWRSVTQSNQIQRETQLYEQSVLDTHRKQQYAQRHHRCALLQRYFLAWQTFVHMEHEQRCLESAQNNTRHKMMALLDAAATGKLWSETSRNDSTSERTLVNAREQTNCQLRATASDSSLCSKDRSSKDNLQLNRIPMQAWQITRKHVNLSVKEMASSGNVVEQASNHTLSRAPQHVEKAPYVVNNFENRYTAQQKVLRGQQKEIRDQKRMIEDLQFAQKQQCHLEDIARQQIIQNHLQNQQNHLQNQQNPLKDQTLKELPADIKGQTSTNLNVNRDMDTGATSSRTVSSHQSTARSNTSNKYLHVLSKMEERTAERKRIKQEREENKKREEEDRLALLQAHEEELKLQMEQEKRAKALAYKEKKRLEREREVAHQRDSQSLKQQMRLADAHYTRALMKYRGIVPLRKLVIMSRTNQNQAKLCYNNQLCRKVLVSWHEHTKRNLQEKNSLADEMGNFIIIKRCFGRWQMYKHHLLIENEKAKQFYKRRILHKVLQEWAAVVTEEKFSYWEKEEMARAHCIRSLKQSAFTSWRRLPEISRMHVERDKRRDEMRRKVASMLSDYDASVDASLDHTTSS